MLFFCSLSLEFSHLIHELMLSLILCSLCSPFCLISSQGDPTPLSLPPRPMYAYYHMHTPTGPKHIHNHGKGTIPKVLNIQINGGKSLTNSLTLQLCQHLGRCGENTNAICSLPSGCLQTNNGAGHINNEP